MAHFSEFRTVSELERSMVAVFYIGQYNSASPDFMTDDLFRSPEKIIFDDSLMLINILRRFFLLTKSFKST